MALNGGKAGQGVVTGQLNTQIVAALSRLQDDMRSVLASLSTLETRALSQVRKVSCILIGQRMWIYFAIFLSSIKLEGLIKKMSCWECSDGLRSDCRVSDQTGNSDLCWWDGEVMIDDVTSFSGGKARSPLHSSHTSGRFKQLKHF